MQKSCAADEKKVFAMYNLTIGIILHPHQQFPYH